MCILNFKYLTNYLILFIFLLNKSNGQYQIPSYYGHWSKNFYKAKSIINGKFSIFQMHFSIEMNFQETKLYIVNQKQHCISQVDLKTNKYTVIAGKCGYKGNRIGSLKTSYFNNPSSIAYWRDDDVRKSYARLSKAHIVANQSCQLSDSQCLLYQEDVNKFPFSINLTLKNIRIEPFYNLYSLNSKFTDQFLFIADKGNHCLKQIILRQQFVDVIAGVCGQKGFRDGPLGYNLLNSPSNLGIDGKGNLYFFDQGNEYMRKLDLDTKSKNYQVVQTLLNGACTQYVREIQKNRFIKNTDYELKKMLCYQNWIQEKTTNPTQHYVQQSRLDICTPHSSKCPKQV